jgi:hypothetical protein
MRRSSFGKHRFGSRRYGYKVTTEVIEIWSLSDNNLAFTVKLIEVSVHACAPLGLQGDGVVRVNVNSPPERPKMQQKPSWMCSTMRTFKLKKNM